MNTAQQTALLMERAQLEKQRAYLSRFATPTATKRLTAVDARLARIAALLAPKPSRNAPRTIIHPATGTVPRGF